VKRLALALIPFVLLAGCGTTTPVEGRIPGRTLRIYMSGALRGASSTAVRAAMNGAEMALAEHGPNIGRYRIVLSVLNDATPQSGGWDPSQTTINVHQAAQDPATIGYIGDFDSGATAISIPVLNRPGIPQLNPTGGAVGLTSAASGASPGEPAKYYPLGTRTFARVAPNNAVEAAVTASLLQTLGCRIPFVLHDGTFDGEDGAISFVLAAQAAGLRVLGVESFPRQATDYAPLAQGLAKMTPAPDCLLIDATDEHSAARVTAAVARALPSARIFAAGQLADPAYIDPRQGGIPASLDPRLLVLAPQVSPSSYPPSGQAFLTRYNRVYGPASPPAIFGYEAMSLMLHAIAVATSNGRRAPDRARVLAAIFATRDRHSVLGTYSIDHNGDTSIRNYGIYGLRAGRLQFLEQETG
jgi:branched-chain amino acid transport system substrate-binding protein